MAATSPETLTLEGGADLKRALRRTERRRRLGAFSLTVPLLLFVLVFFFLPLFKMFWLSIANPTIPEYMPHTVQALRDWSPSTPVPEAAYKAVAEDLKHARADHTFGRIAKRLNEEQPGSFTLINKTAMRISRVDHGPWKAALIKIDKAWGEKPIWRLLKRQSAPFTADFYLASLDMKYNQQGQIVQKPVYDRVYVPLFIRTFWMSAVITLLTVLLGYPLAYWLTALPDRTSNLLMICVLLPFWTSLLVRTTSWIVLLQGHGVINNVLVWAHIIGDQHRLKLIYNQFGTIVAMTQVLLPFMILPLYSVMRGISPSYLRAGISLGAHPARAFWKIYMPLTLPGIGAGGLLVFILSIGYYITPELVGGQSGQFISNMIVYNVQQSLNWGLAAALGTLLTGAALVFYLIYNRLVGAGKVSLG
ncbi:ABC transporter permease [Acidihalobacter ferrooxydans]|uniref:ABC transporter permease n=1 Tax=Acidihalobacter ferrooxydans TaxID=1765967 RepID=A0A1P8UKM0_9GAMM|nr:ABC transporter permease [Acidihalobacter ferrooxydans]APZ44334.1 ABC transporter permease [Acidihalobacter ferrooxydans]